MNNNNIIFFCGIDISKKTIDATIIDNQGKELYHIKSMNTEKGYLELLKSIKEKEIKLDEVLFCCENTGIYSLPIANYLYEKKHIIWVENSLSIKKSLGLIRGKNDKADSSRIGKYAYRHKDKFKAYKPLSKVLEKSKELLALRERMVKIAKILEVPIKEAASMGYTPMQATRESANKILKISKAEIKKIEGELEKLISTDE